jgi:hypothetical protein
MASITDHEFERQWDSEHDSLRQEYKNLVCKYPDASDIIKQVIKVLSDIVSLAKCTPVCVGKSESWQSVVNCAMQDRVNLCQVLKGKSLFRALYGVYTVTLSELKLVLQNSAAKGPMGPTPPTPSDGNPEEFKEMKRRRRNPSTDDSVTVSEKPASVQRPAKCEIQQKVAIPTRNFYAPLTTMDVEIQNEITEETDPSTQQQQQTAKGAGRPPPIVLTSSVNLIKLERDIKSIAKNKYEFRTTRNGIRVMTKEMADYSAIKHHLEQNTFHPKSEKPIKAVFRHLPGDTPAEDISNELVALGFSVISVRQMTASRQLPQGGTQIVNFSLFLVTLARNQRKFLT